MSSQSPIKFTKYLYRDVLLLSLNYYESRSINLSYRKFAERKYTVFPWPIKQFIALSLAPNMNLHIKMHQYFRQCNLVVKHYHKSSTISQIGSSSSIVDSPLHASIRHTRLARMGAKSPRRAFGAFIKRIHLQIKFTIFKMLSISLQLHFNE